VTLWTFITNHGAVLVYIAKHKRAKAIEIATQLGITERTVRRITADLEAEGYICKTKDGRVNLYEINPNLPLRRPEIQDTKVQELLSIFLPQAGNERRPT